LTTLRGLIDGVRETPLARLILLLAAIALGAAAFARAFHPQFLSFDSYHYMVLSYLPEVGNAHPLGFGWVLRALRALSERHRVSYPYLYQVWQVGCLAALVFAWRVPLSELEAKGGPLVLSARIALMIIFFGLLVPALVFVMNAFWTDMTSFLVLALSVMAFDRALRTSSPAAWTGFVLCAVAGVYVRYQLVVLPLAGVLVALVLGRARRAVPADRLLHTLIALLATALLAWGSAKMLAASLPETRMARQNAGVFLQKSLQCRLRCSVKLYAVDCSTRAGQTLIEHASCTDLIAEQVDLGKPVIEPVRLGQTFAHVGAVGTLKWLALAPLTYLRESYYSFDIESYGFDRRIRILSRHPDALAPYARSLPPFGARPAPAFERIVAWLSWLYYELRAFHVLAGLMLATSTLVLGRTRSPAAAFFASVCLLTYLVFSTLQPKAPLHYLVQIAVPGFLAAAIALRSAVSRAERSDA
jgi:hypothetical protein